MRSHTFHLASILIVALTAAVPSGQSKAPVPLQDYGKFETLPPQPRAGLSPDGKWLAYGINRSNRDNELRIVAVASGTPKVVAFGSQAAFSADSQWLAYAIGQSEAQEEKLRQQKKPIQRKLGTLRLASGDMTTVEGIETFAFNASGTHLAMKRYAPERKDQPEQPAADDAPAGTTLIVRELATGRDTTFGNVTEFVWQDKGKLLALTISADDKTGNGVQLFDPESGSLRVLDSAAAIYTGLTWRKEADDLAVLRGATDDHHDGATHAILAWRKPGTIASFDPLKTAGVPAGSRIVSYRRPSWSDDGRTIFVGIGRWTEKVPGPAKPKDGDKGDKPGEKPADKDAAREPDEQAAVEVWHARDVDVMPRQKINARNDRQRNTLAAWHVDSGQFVQLGSELTERVVPLRHQRLAYAVNWTPYAMERTIGRPLAPIWEDLPAYIRNSAVFGISTMKTPLLVAFGDNDGTVHWHQGVEFYNIARRAKKDVVMLVYGGEDRQQPPQAEPARLSAPDRPVVRPLPERRAGAAVDHERRQLSRSRARAEESQVRKGILMGAAARAAALLAVAVMASALSGAATPAPRVETLRVLFIGNSLTAANGLPEIVESLSKARGDVTVEATAITASNFSLEDHWNQGSARATVAKGNWSFVVLQQGPSALPESRVLLREYARRFAGEARKTGARTALYMVWPAKARSRDFDAVSESYALAARDVDGVLIPAGDAWREVWRRDPQTALYGSDDFHPSALGSYVAALTIWRALSGASVVGLPGPSSISSGMLPLLQVAADRATAVSGSASRSGGPR